MHACLPRSMVEKFFLRDYVRSHGLRGLFDESECKRREKTLRNIAYVELIYWTNNICEQNFWSCNCFSFLIIIIISEFRGARGSGVYRIKERKSIISIDVPNDQVWSVCQACLRFGGNFGKMCLLGHGTRRDFLMAEGGDKIFHNKLYRPFNQLKFGANLPGNLID